MMIIIIIITNTTTTTAMAIANTITRMMVMIVNGKRAVGAIASTGIARTAKMSQSA